MCVCVCIVDIFTLWQITYLNISHVTSSMIKQNNKYSLRKLYICNDMHKCMDTHIHNHTNTCKQPYIHIYTIADIYTYTSIRTYPLTKLCMPTHPYMSTYVLTS